MPRYIDADKIDWRLIIPTNVTIAEENMIHNAKKLVERPPTADVKLDVKGENLGGGAFLCSACGFDDVAHSHTVKFCPNCGAEIINARPADEDDSGLRR